MEPIPVLQAIEGPLTGRQWEITQNGLYLGREARNEIRIEEAGISRQHARVLLHNGTIWVQDIGSRNGVFVNGNRVPDNKQVKPGDRLVVGSNTFEIAMRSRAQAPAPPPPGEPQALTVPWPLVGIAALLLGLGLTTLVWYIRQP